MAVGGKDVCKLNGRSDCSGRLFAERKAAGEPIASRCAGFHEFMPIGCEMPDSFWGGEQNEKALRERGTRLGKGRGARLDME